MDIDPEVEALLNDVPPIPLPQKLRAGGWGRQTMAEVQSYSVFEHTVKPSTTFQPTFEPCAQCGKPIAEMRGIMKDHAGRDQCDGALVDGEQAYEYHCTQGGLDLLLKQREELEAWSQEQLLRLNRTEQTRRAGKKLKALGPCNANMATRTCHHVCDHPSDHFGFHECKRCRHLWR